jgi:hypothetical protein
MKGRSSWEPSLRWESNIKVDITEVEHNDFDLCDMAQDKLKGQFVVQILKTFPPPLTPGNYF